MMVAERKTIDLEDIAGGDVLASELDSHPDGLILRRGGREIAVLSTISDANVDQNVNGPKWKTMTPEERETFRSLAGAWIGLVDFVQLDADRVTQREESLRLDEDRRRRLGFRDAPVS